MKMLSAKVNVLALTFFLLLTVIPISIYSLPAVDIPTKDLTFQPNSIPEVNVYYEDYSFVFEYKSYFIRVMPFVIYNSEYYGMKRIVQFIKNQYPNIDYKWLVDKATNAIHYGYNLTKLPQNVADKIDYLGFRLVDYNFPLSWFELETHTAESYDATVIRLPKANLAFSFDDLYPQGYSIQHVNKTYVLIGQVKGKTDLIVDPITYSAGEIQGTGGSAGSPLTFWDYWNASDVNGWDVVLRTNDTVEQYYFDNVTMVIGDDATPTYFKDTKCQVYFYTSLRRWNAHIRVEKKVWLQLGEVADTNSKTGIDGCQLYFDSPNDGLVYGILHSGDATTAYRFYATTFGQRSVDVGVTAGSTNVTIWDCFFDRSRLQGSAIGGDYNRLTVTGVRISGTVGTLNDIYIYDVAREAYHKRGYTVGGVEVTNLKVRNATHLAFMERMYSSYNFTDADTDTWAILWRAGPTYNSTGEVYRKYSFDLTVQHNGNQTAIQNVNVTLTDINGTRVFSELTNAQGQINTKKVIYEFHNQTANNASDDSTWIHWPHNLTLTGVGLTTYTTIINITAPVDWTIAMSPVVTALPSYYLPMFIIGIVLFISSIIYLKGRKH